MPRTETGSAAAALLDAALTPDRVALIAAIARTGSINRAAREVGISYKTAWQAVDAINNLSDRPIVSRVSGGRGGGGTVLTARGTALLATCEALGEAQRRWQAAARDLLTRHPEDLALLMRLAMRTSARNQFYGRIASIDDGAVNDNVRLRLKGGMPLVAQITRASREELGLVAGGEALALIKAGWVMLLRGEPTGLGCANRFPGTVARIDDGAVNCDVILTLDSGDSVCAQIDRDSLARLALAPGDPAWACFAASNVILAAAPASVRYPTED